MEKDYMYVPKTRSQLGLPKKLSLINNWEVSQLSALGTFVDTISTHNHS